MKNCILTITGQKGSGKTSLTKLLAQQATRVVIVDRMVEYDGFLADGFVGAIDYLALHWTTDFRLVCRFTSDLYHRELFRFLFYATERVPTNQIAVIVEEADFFCSPHGIEPTLDALFKYGRHRRINLVAVARGDTDLHRSVLNNSDCIVAFRQMKLSRDMRERFTADELESITQLQTLTPNDKPIKGTHYLTYPRDADPFQLWGAGVDFSASDPHLEGAPGAPARSARQ